MRIIVTITLLFSFSVLFGQKYLSKKSSVVFFSEAPIENITAENVKSTSVVDLSTGKVAFSIPITQFIFDKSLMQEHFNDQYMESEKFPKSSFVGVIEDLDIKTNGRQELKAKGALTIHGVEQQIVASGWVEVDKKRIVIESEFFVKLEDYKIKIPQILWQNIAEEIQVKIHFEYEPYK